MENYIGHPQQLYGVEEMRLVGGKGDGMRLLQVRNGKGLAFTVSLDRCADVVRLSHKGDNFGYFAPCGYVSPQHYDREGAGFLKSFTAGFCTTCGLTAVGSPCVDQGETLPLHGTISHTPCENVGHWITDGEIHIKAIVRDSALFGHQMLLTREYVCPLDENAIYLTDVVENIGPNPAPFEILYHCNMGYPLLSERTKLTIPADSVTPRDSHAASGLDSCLVMVQPQPGYEEMCFYHHLTGTPVVEIFNPDLGKGLAMTFDTAELAYFTQWKMMGIKEYVLGLEPGNCTPDGRDVMRKQGRLRILQQGEQTMLHLKWEIKTNY